jgi:hypothetical protein
MMRLRLCDTRRMMMSVVAQMLPAEMLPDVCTIRMRFAARELGIGQILLLKAELLFLLEAKLLLLLLSQELLLLLRYPTLGRITPAVSCLTGTRKCSSAIRA